MKMNRCLLPIAVSIIPLAVVVDRAFAEFRVPVQQVIAQIERGTKIPIFIPTTVPTDQRIYANVQADRQGYYLSFDLTPDCGGSTPCRLANLEARRGEAFYADATTQSVQLVGSIRGTYTNVRGPYYTALVQWKYKDVLYKAAVKNGRKQDAIAFANSAISGGIRTTKPSTSAASEIYMGKASTGESVFFVGARFQCGDLPRTDECWTRTPVIAYRIGMDRVSAIGDCQQQLFREVWLDGERVAQQMRPQSVELRRVLAKACGR